MLVLRKKVIGLRPKTDSPINVGPGGVVVILMLFGTDGSLILSLSQREVVAHSRHEKSLIQLLRSSG